MPNLYCMPYLTRTETAFLDAITVFSMWAEQRCAKFCLSYLLITGVDNQAANVVKSEMAKLWPSRC